ncbi:PulJ/GspJ family protein [Cerasicoccus frondis]|uniref:PulJ/GspJ family protein n=1 Tax=Cerasicoccus frondis TaxID=490090 RepID=UPI002852B265|nr:prepilin-type N-terminal cleavage/methylation domain-containing protein [Cerasicoccus frondis]
MNSYIGGRSHSKTKAGFTLAEILVGLFIVSLLSLIFLRFLDSLARFEQLQYDYIRSSELADQHFKQLKSASYSEALYTLGISATETGASSETILENSIDGYTVSSIAEPNKAYGATASDSVQVEITVSWNHLGDAKNRSYVTTLLSGGLAQ